jgi:hypothetical protein
MLLAAVAVLASVAAYWMLVLSPKREQATKLSASISKKQGDLEAAKAEVGTYELAKAGYKANYTLIARLGKAVPADDDVRSLLVQINSAAGRSKVDFRSIALGVGAAPAAAAGTAGAAGAAAPTPPGASTVGTAGFAQMPFTLAFKGSFFSLGDFLKRLDRFVSVKQQRMDVTGRLMVLDKVSLLPDATGFPHMRAQVSATTYLLPAAEGLTAGATAAGPGTAKGSTPAAPGATATPAASPSTPTAAIGATP